MTRVKQSSLAGTWYAGDEAGLRRQVDGFLKAPSGPPLGSLAGLVVPHAGYAYSGRVAGAAYATLAGGSYRRAIILAPSHFAAFRGATLLDIDVFETPLGRIAVDAEAMSRLQRQPLFRDDPEPYRDEHSLEIQLPFLQRVLPEVRVLPALLGSLADEDYAVLARGLRTVLDERTLFIVSSDFVHYGWRFGYLPFPADGPEHVRAGLRDLDMGAINYVCAGDGTGFRDFVARTGATICGRVAISAFLTVHSAMGRGRLLMYSTSLDVTGDYEHSVSYASIAFPRTS